jgi:hypothetical protein
MSKKNTGLLLLVALVLILALVMVMMSTTTYAATLPSSWYDAYCAGSTCSIG